MPSREQMIATAEAYARSLGWTEVETADAGTAVEMLLGAPGASEQVVTAPLSKLRKALKEWGGPEDYSAVEEYDFETAVVEAGAEEDCYVEEAENQAEFDAALEMAREAPDPEQEQDAATEEDEATAQPEAKRTEGTLTDMLYDPKWAERCEQGPSVKELHRALERVGDTGPDGIPRPEQLIPAEEDLMPGGKIVARRGEEVMKFGFAIRPQVKVALEEAGWSFTHIVAAARGDSTVAIESGGKVTIAKVQRVGDRLINTAGGMLTVSKQGVSFQVKSISVDYAKAGWHIV